MIACIGLYNPQAKENMASDIVEILNDAALTMIAASPLATSATPVDPPNFARVPSSYPNTPTVPARVVTNPDRISTRRIRKLRLSVCNGEETTVT